MGAKLGVHILGCAVGVHDPPWCGANRQIVEHGFLVKAVGYSAENIGVHKTCLAA